MSWQPVPEPACSEKPAVAPPDQIADHAVEQVIVPRVRDLGGFEVRRALPAARRQMVGPFIFFDQMGPSPLIDGQSLEVRPHPHIGLATVTYLFSGAIMHRDSLGTVQEIAPGAVNLMTAGSGIAHSERTSQAHNLPGAEIFGIQTWLALPREHEETAPAFVHHGAEALPTIAGEGLDGRVIIGSLYGRKAPVETLSPTAYADIAMARGARLPLPDGIEECGLYVVSGAIALDGQRFGDGTLVVIRPGARGAATALDPSRVMVLGGDAMDGHRHIWWNFVSSSKERIEDAKADWKAGRFDPVIGDDEFIPLPER
ncbi:MAG: pirin family protein [Azospirillaceae bacterium]